MEHNQTTAGKSKSKMGGKRKYYKFHSKKPQTLNPETKNQESRHLKEAPQSAPIGKIEETTEIQPRKFTSCAICSDDKISFVATGHCNHPICSLCALRIRYKSNDHSCSICKSTLNLMIIYDVNDIAENVTFQEFGIDDEQLQDSPPIPSTIYDSDTGLLFWQCKSHYSLMARLKSIHCPCADSQCTFIARNNQALIQHVQHAHSLSMCTLCLEHRPLFAFEQEVMTKKDLQSHLKGIQLAGNNSSYFLDALPNNPTGQVAYHKFIQGHPRCEFCKSHYFDANSLYQHLTRSHFTCHLCDASKMFRYYKDLYSLKDHHRQHHFICSICDSDPEITSSDVCCAFRTTTEYHSHMKEMHNMSQASRINVQLGRIQYTINANQQNNQKKKKGNDSDNKHGNNNNQKEEELAYFDLDVGSANPFPNSARDPPQTATSSSNNNTNNSFNEAFPPVLPPNMRVSGKVGGTGRLLPPDASDLLLQEMSDAAHRKATVRNNLAYATGKVSKQFFPTLADVTPPENKQSAGLQKEAVTIAISSPATVSAVSAAAHVDTVNSNGNSSDPNSTTNTNAKLHPMSLVNKIKPSGTNTSSSASQVAAAEDRRIARNLALAEAFGIKGDKLSAETLGANINHQVYRQSLSQQLTAYKLPPTILCAPVFPLEMVQWAKQHHTELCKVERKIHLLLQDTKQTSVSLKPMKAYDRMMVHCLAKYYHLQSYEYDYEPQRYVSLVKTIQSAVPELLLSDACMKAVFNTVKYADETRKALMTSSTAIIEENPVIYLHLIETQLVASWGRATDRAKTSSSPNNKYLPFHSSLVIFGEIILKLQELLISTRQIDEREIRAVSISAAGPTAIAIQFRTLAAAKYADALLRQIQEEANKWYATTNNAALWEFEHFGIFPYFKIYTDFLSDYRPTSHSEDQHSVYDSADNIKAAAAAAAASTETVGIVELPLDDGDAEFEIIDSWDDGAYVATSSAAPATLPLSTNLQLSSGDYQEDEDDADNNYNNNNNNNNNNDNRNDDDNDDDENDDDDDWEVVAESNEWNDFLAQRRQRQPVDYVVYRPPFAVVQPSSHGLIEMDDDEEEDVVDEEGNQSEGVAMMEDNVAAANEEHDHSQEDFLLAVALQELENQRPSYYDDDPSSWQAVGRVPTISASNVVSLDHDLGRSTSDRPPVVATATATATTHPNMNANSSNHIVEATATVIVPTAVPVARQSAASSISSLHNSNTRKKSNSNKFNALLDDDEDDD
jgi:hypothetical protein